MSQTKRQKQPQSRSQRQAQRQAAQKERFEGILSNALLRWLNKIKRDDENVKQFQQSLEKLLNNQYNKIIAVTIPQTLKQVKHALTANESVVLETIILAWAASNAIIRAGIIINTFQKWRNTMNFIQWKGRVQTHIQSTIANTEVQPVFENSKHEAAMFVARATAFGKVKNKIWITILDGRERPAHGAANFQSVSIANDFVVGGENLRFPGDPTGSLPNIINCRCSMIFS